MSRVADEPITKVTLNLYTRDVEMMRKRYANYTEEIRRIVHREMELKRKLDRAMEDE